ncbi:hypothetical protein CDIK_2873 [Cucumispora dikerogammari]|nr:hypothetical protein CDIK_2873 [Cucumispora dikerogammari]
MVIPIQNRDPDPIRSIDNPTSNNKYKYNLYINNKMYLKELQTAITYVRSLMCQLSDNNTPPLHHISSPTRPFNNNTTNSENNRPTSSFNHHSPSIDTLSAQSDRENSSSRHIISSMALPSHSDMVYFAGSDINDKSSIGSFPNKLDKFLSSENSLSHSYTATNSVINNRSNVICSINNSYIFPVPQSLINNSGLIQDLLMCEPPETNTYNSNNNVNIYNKKGNISLNITPELIDLIIAIEEYVTYATHQLSDYKPKSISKFAEYNELVPIPHSDCLYTNVTIINNAYIHKNKDIYNNINSIDMIIRMIINNINNLHIHIDLCETLLYLKHTFTDLVCNVLAEKLSVLGDDELRKLFFGRLGNSSKSNNKNNKVSRDDLMFLLNQKL